MESRFKGSYTARKANTTHAARTRAYLALIRKLRKKNDYSLHESSLFIPADTEYQSSIVSILRPLRTVSHVVLIGIGGSNLGTEAVYEALKTDKTPELYVLDSINETRMDTVASLIETVASLRDIAIVIVSKSGNTTETIANATRVLTLLEKRFGTAGYEQVVCVGNGGTPLMRAAEEKGIRTVSMPEVIGGRYSVFTAVGIVPLTLLRINVKELLKGATEALADDNLKQIEARALALGYYTGVEGVHTVNFFTFTPRLERIASWYRQLLAESIGKRTTNAGTPFTTPLNPVVTVSADLHSIAELYLGGYRGIYTRFVYEARPRAYALPKKHWLASVLPMIAGKTTTDITTAIREGVIKAYDEQHLPTEHIVLSGVTPYEVGYLLSSLMAEVMCVGSMFDIDPFNQPSVELYKSHTRTILNKS